MGSKLVARLFDSKYVIEYSEAKKHKGEPPYQLKNTSMYFTHDREPQGHTHLWSEGACRDLARYVETRVIPNDITVFHLKSLERVTPDRKRRIELREWRERKLNNQKQNYINVNRG